MRPDRRAETAKIQARSITLTGTHDPPPMTAESEALPRFDHSFRVAEAGRFDAGSLPLVQRLTSSPRQATARLASLAGAGNACSAIIL